MPEPHEIKYQSAIIMPRVASRDACVPGAQTVKNEGAWHPTKFVTTPRGLRASRDPREVAVASRLSADMVAPYYEQMLVNHVRGRLLDLGAGQAPLYGVYGKLADTVTCVDWPGSLHASPYVDVFADLNERLPFDDGTYDTLLLTDVLEHIARPEMLWPEMKRILAPGGKLLLTTPFLYWIHEAPHDYARYTEYMLRCFCDRYGFSVVDLQATGGSPEVLLDLIGRHFAFSVLVSRLHHACARALLALPPVRSLSRHSRRSFPLGYTLVAVA